MNKRSNGFTVIELLFVIVLVAGATILFFVQKNNVEIGAHDSERKTAINAMYYSLEEVFYPANNYYPVSIDAKTLPSVDPSLFEDPDGYILGEAKSNYHYEALNCTDNKCKSYTLRAELQNEADFVKQSRRN